MDNPSTDPTGIPWESVAVMLYLSRLRSEAILGQALAKHFPTTEAWEGFMADPIVHEEIQSFAGVVEDIRSGQASALALTPEVVAELAAPHMTRALEALSLTAERLGIDAEHLLVALVGV